MFVAVIIQAILSMSDSLNWHPFHASHAYLSIASFYSQSHLVLIKQILWAPCLSFCWAVVLWLIACPETSIWMYILVLLWVNFFFLPAVSSSLRRRHGRLNLKFNTSSSAKLSGLLDCCTSQFNRDKQFSHTSLINWNFQQLSPLKYWRVGCYQIIVCCFLKHAMMHSASCSGSLLCNITSLSIWMSKLMQPKSSVPALKGTLQSGTEEIAYRRWHVACILQNVCYPDSKTLPPTTVLRFKQWTRFLYREFVAILCCVFIYYLFYCIVWFHNLVILH